MEEILYRNNRTELKWYSKLSSSWLFQELYIVNKLAWPCVCTAFLAQLLPLISLIFIGHIGTGVYLDGAALAISFSNITGTSIVIGMGYGMVTLCSQAYGAHNYRLVGVYFQRAMIICLLFCFPIWALWLNAEQILVLLNQDLQVAKVTGEYLRVLCLAKPAVIIYLLSARYMQSQNIVLPTIFLTFSGNVVNVVCNYIFISLLDYGVKGSAISLTIAYWSLALGYMLYIRYSSIYRSAWPGWSTDALKGWLHYCKYGIPGLIMLCLEWWIFEFGFLVVGSTSYNPRVEVGIFTIMFNVSTITFTLPLGYSTATAVRVGNLLGANNPNLARKVSYLCIVINLVFGIMFSVGLFALRPYLPTLFTADKCIIAGAAKALLVIAIYKNVDGIRKVETGILNGCGRQAIASIINFVVFVLIGGPLAIYLSVVLKLYTKGFWTGMATAIVLQALIFFMLIVFTNWRKVVDKAQQNTGLIKSTNSSSLTNYTRLLTHTQNEWRSPYRHVVKGLIVGMLITSFVVGIYFSVTDTSSKGELMSVLFNNSTINTTLICAYN